MGCFSFLYLVMQTQSQPFSNLKAQYIDAKNMTSDWRNIYRMEDVKNKSVMQSSVTDKVREWFRNQQYHSYFSTTGYELRWWATLIILLQRRATGEHLLTWDVHTDGTAIITFLQLLEQKVPKIGFGSNKTNIAELDNSQCWLSSFARTC